MSGGTPVGFWSYAHRDNDLDRGRVGTLAQDISDEFELQTGESLEMFVDNRSIRWGEEWLRSIDRALDYTSFFIPIITPLYWRSVECRRELQEFSSHLSAARKRRVLLPILYSDTPAIADSKSTDDLAQLVRRTQYEDWRALRLVARNSAEYRRAVNGMVVRIIEICRPDLR